MPGGFKPTNFDPIYTGQVWGGLTIGSPAGGDLSGTYPEATVSGLQGTAIEGIPTDGQVLTYASASNAWIPEPPATSNPMTTEGDMIYQHSGAEDRLAVGGAHEVLHGGTDPNYAAVTEDDLSLSDVTTADVSTSAHGFAPKADGTASHYLDGTGAYSTPTGTGGIADMGAFTYLDPSDQASDPAAPASGKHRLYSKSDGLYIEDSTGAVTGPLRASSALDHVEFTSPVSITATTEATATTVVTGSAVSYDGSTEIMVECYAPYWRPSAAAAGYAIRLCLYDGSSSIGVVGVQQNMVYGYSPYVQCVVRRKLTPSSGSHTYSLRAFVSADTGEVGAGVGGSGNYVPGYIRITRA